MESAQLQRLDFSSPRKPPGTKWRALAKWHQGLCMLTAESWNVLLSHEVTISPTRSEPQQYRSALAKYPELARGVQLTIGPDEFPSLVVISQRQLHGLLADILNLPGTEWPPLRKFTRAEQAMLDVMMQKFAVAAGDGIPGPEATSCKFAGLLERPERTRLFAQINEVFVCEFEIKSRFGVETGCWLLPRRGTEELLGEEYPEEDPEVRGVHPTLESLARRIEVDVVVELGKCDIAMSQVAELSVGDVLILEQPIHRPLTAYVSGERKWLGQPLRVGTRQGFEVVELVSG
jgi:flagellar motor switch protein FliM